MTRTVEALAVVGALLALIGCYAAAVWVRHLLRRRPQLPRRTPADVHRDAATHRACHHFRQAIDDHDTVWTIWPDPPSWRIAHTQWRLDQRKDNGT
ncbi:hypothetical protein [Streptomyces pacificus]|uniref:Uncharacterized protein n=1 Tax=Streptomyces pacificus TaxID=2705029 RepID=A0A6A0ANX5_9ACTN|nr:hypothetical protein [Streptomyces pacificus]GFH34338.1 hypothetical protein SCWH03_05520 [Streptomyces pacificus]